MTAWLTATLAATPPGQKAWGLGKEARPSGAGIRRLLLVGAAMWMAAMPPGSDGRGWCSAWLVKTGRKAGQRSVRKKRLVAVWQHHRVAPLGLEQRPDKASGGFDSRLGQTGRKTGCTGSNAGWTGRDGSPRKASFLKVQRVRPIPATASATLCVTHGSWGYATVWQQAGRAHHEPRCARR